MVIERYRTWPRNVMHTLLVQLPKADGLGFRLIGLLSTIFRIWGRLRQPYFRKWEESIRTAVDFSARGGNGAIDTVWDNAFEEELCAAQGRKVASSISDLSKFYERICHDLLLHECRNLTCSDFCSIPFPLLLAEMCVLNYESTRHCVAGGSISAGVVTFCGVIAGCTGATYLAKALLVRPLGNFAVGWPWLSIKVYLDDILVRWRGRDSSDAVQLLNCTVDLVDLMRDKIRCPVGTGAKGPHFIAADSRVLCVCCSLCGLWLKGFADIKASPRWPKGRLVPTGSSSLWPKGRHPSRLEI